MNIKIIFIFGIALALLVSVMTALVIRLGSRNQKDDSIIKKDEVIASARILDIIDTGSRYNYNPVVKLKLKIQPENGIPFEAEIRTVISVVDLPMYQSNAVVRVKYKPTSPSDAVILIR
jgi:hypothetical protein